MSVCLAAFGVLRLQDWDGGVEVVVDDDLGPTLVSAQGAADGLRDQPRERDGQVSSSGVVGFLLRR